MGVSTAQVGMVHRLNTDGRYISPKYWLAFVVTGWGIASLCQGLTKSYGGMIACVRRLDNVELIARELSLLLLKLVVPRPSPSTCL